MKTVYEIQEMFQDESQLHLVIEDCKDTIDKINYWQNVLLQGVLDGAEQAKSALQELTGAYMGLQPYLTVAETEKKVRENEEYQRIRQNTTGKFTSAVAEKEASTLVNNYRRVRNYLQGYNSMCEKAISSIQSVLKFMGEEIRLNR
ncbi:MAG: hypothetical protein ACTSPD_10195 [Promethearchaeota archaeon]